MVAAPVVPDPHTAGVIEYGARSCSSLCWTCSTCDNECPVNTATGRLRPQKIVRMACLGMLTELLALPEIWLCLDCGRCSRACSQQVRGRDIIRRLRRLALEQGVVDPALPRRLEELDRHTYARLQLEMDVLMG